MAQSCKRKTKASLSISPDSDICSPEGKKACNSPRSEQNISVVFSEDDQVLEALNMTEKIATQLVYADFPKEISERRKKPWPRLKKAREEGKSAFFSKPEPGKLFINGRFVPL